jgi:hypothetical protein
VLKSLNAIVEGFEYDSKRGIPKIFFTGGLLYGHVSDISYIAEDLFYSKESRYPVAFCEAIGSTGTRKARHMFFRGLFGIAYIGERYTREIIIKSKTLQQAEFGTLFFPTYDKWVAKRTDLRRIEYDDAAFSAIFDVYACDSDYAGTVVTPELRAGMVRIRERTNREFHLSLIHQVLFVTIPAPRNLFDAAVMKPVNYDNVKEDFLFIETMLSMLDELGIEVEPDARHNLHDLLYRPHRLAGGWKSIAN